jgi:hypothetical protein
MYGSVIPCIKIILQSINVPLYYLYMFYTLVFQQNSQINPLPPVALFKKKINLS